MMSRVDQSQVIMFLSVLLLLTGTLPAHANNPILSLPLSPRTRNNTALIIADIARVNYLNSRLRPDSDNIQAIQTPVSLMGGTFVAEISIGQPGTRTKLAVDTGSEIIWVKCRPVNSNPVFDPSTSTSFNKLNCTDPQCTWRTTPELTCPGYRCCFQAAYGDGSTARGNYVTETLSFGSSGAVDNIAIGCAHEVTGHVQSIDGILGLGPESISLNSQLRATSFSYCLSYDPATTTSTTLDFNAPAPPFAVTFPMIRNPNKDIYYYVELTGIAVGTALIPIPPDFYQIGLHNVGGVILDSGTTLTYLDAGVYQNVLEAFLSLTRHLVPSPPMGGLDACFDIPGGVSSFRGPQFTLSFSHRVSFAIPPKNYLIRMGDNNKYCLAMKPTNQVVSIIGFITQMGFRVTHDLVNRQISFSPRKC